MRVAFGQELFVCRGAFDPRDNRDQRLGYRELLPGGRAAGLAPRHFDPQQLAVGTRVELEHTRSVALAREIAMDHLAEDPDYYRKLATVHLDGATQLGIVEELLLEVEKRAEKRVKPLVVAAIAMGALGLIAGGVALVVATRR
jgi:hypothetical protein